VLSHEQWKLLVGFILIIAPIVFISLLLFTAPYGRHHKKGWGIAIDTRWAWFLMELPAVLVMIYWLIKGHQTGSLFQGAILFFFIWQWHYVYRTFYFPFKLKASKRAFPLLLIAFALIFNTINGSINGWYLFISQPFQGAEFLRKPHFYLGLILFIIGFYTHWRSDKIILDLRSDHDHSYKIPQGFLFKHITNPNYFGEFIQWCGWAVLTWSIAGAAFALFTFANLFPRALKNHKWYQEHFDEYPKERKRFFPYIY